MPRNFFFRTLVGRCFFQINWAHPIQLRRNKQKNETVNVRKQERENRKTKERKEQDKLRSHNAWKFGTASTHFNEGSIVCIIYIAQKNLPAKWWQFQIEIYEINKSKHPWKEKKIDNVYVVFFLECEMLRGEKNSEVLRTFDG